MKERFVLYAFPTAEVYGFTEEAVQTEKRVRVVNCFLTTVSLAAVPVTFSVGISRVDLVLIRQAMIPIVGGTATVVTLSVPEVVGELL